ncbi:hypothetical protein [Methylomarinum vadi]|nr:hypothetical protein [Methylomarinum vadi]
MYSVLDDILIIQIIKIGHRKRHLQVISLTGLG